mgnify:CR=1 FL=1
MHIENTLMMEILDKSNIQADKYNQEAVEYYKGLLSEAISQGKYLHLFSKYSQNNRKTGAGLEIFDVEKSLNAKIQYYVEILNIELKEKELAD